MNPHPYIESMNRDTPKSRKPLELQTYWFIAVVIVYTVALIVLADSLFQSHANERFLSEKIIKMRYYQLK